MERLVEFNTLGPQQQVAENYRTKKRRSDK